MYAFPLRVNPSPCGPLLFHPVPENFKVWTVSVSPPCRFLTSRVFVISAGLFFFVFFLASQYIASSPTSKAPSSVESRRIGSFSLKELVPRVPSPPLPPSCRHGRLFFEAFFPLFCFPVDGLRVSLWFTRTSRLVQFFFRNWPHTSRLRFAGRVPLLECYSG